MRRGLPVIGLLLALAMSLAWNAEASAHAALTGSEPADGAILDVAPPRFILRSHGWYRGCPRQPRRETPG